MQTYDHHSDTHMQPTTTEGIRPCLFSGDSGDTRDFLLWLNHIQVYLKKLPSVEERILSLYQATAGEARDVMEAFLFEPKTQTTLDSALMTLREIYGSEPMVVEDYLNCLEVFPPIEERDVGTLRSYVNLLRKGLSMTKMYPSLQGIDSRGYLMTVMKRLPDSLKESCVERLMSEKPSETFGLHELVSILEQKLRVLSHPWLRIRHPN